jgi:hypothetical protein
MAKRLDRQGSLQERQRFGQRLIAVLDHADPGTDVPDPHHDRFEEFWLLASSLTFDPDFSPITIINGKLVEREPDTLTPATAVRMKGAKHRRARGERAAAGSGRCG